MKKAYTIGIVAIVLIVCAMFLYVSTHQETQEDINATEYQVISQKGVSLIIPNNWVGANSSSNKSILAVADPSSKSSNGFYEVNVNIEKKGVNNSLDYEFESNYKTLSYNSSYEMLFTGNLSDISGCDAVEADYTSESNGLIKQHKAIWIKKGEKIYVILCSAPQSKFTEVEPTFNSIIESFKFT